MTIFSLSESTTGANNVIITISHCVMGLLFIFAGIVQLNDPDPFVWIFAYWGGAIAVLTTAFSSSKDISKGMVIFSGILPAYLMGFSFLGFTREYKKVWIGEQESDSLTGLSYLSFFRKIIEIEEAREAIGMLFLCAYLVIAYISCQKPVPVTEKPYAEDPMNVDSDGDGKLEKTDMFGSISSYTTAIFTAVVAFGYAMSWIGWNSALSNDSVTVGEHCKGIL